MANRYFVCTRHRPPVEFQIANERPVPDAEIAYFIRGFQILERDYAFNGWTVCFAWSSKVKLPHLGERVVAVIYGDEHCRVPAYVNAVAAVIKCHGFFPTFVPRLRPLRLAQIELAEFLRNLALWLPTGWRWLLSAEARSRCHLVPLGWGLPSHQPPLPLAERPYITSFLGSVPPRLTGLRALVGTPKRYCRTAAIRVLQQLAKVYGQERIPTSLTLDFQQSIKDDGRIYFQVLTRSKICVAPRGTAHETLRIYEGLNFGCVIIADRLPRHPFYKDSPIFEIADWRDLPGLLERLLMDPERLEELHRTSLAYYRAMLSEEALGSRYARALSLRPSTAARKGPPAKAAA